jgi:hypothetical protein
MKPSVGESFQESVDSLYGGRTTSPEPFEIANPTLKGISGLLRDLLQQMDEYVEVIRGP